MGESVAQPVQSHATDKLVQAEVGCQRITTETLVTSFPNIPKLIPQEVQNKRQCFENLVSEAESAGEHLSDGELKAIIVAKMLAEAGCLVEAGTVQSKGEVLVD